MANTKGKIIIGAGIALVGGTIAMVVYKSIRKKKIAEKIYKALDDVTTAEGLSATLEENEIHKANFGFDPNFWKSGKNGIMPDTKYLIPSMYAREKATKIYNAIHNNDLFGVTEDENTVISEIKKAKSQGELSQITHAYESGALNYGNMGDDVETALKSTWYGSKDRLKELNNFISALPY